MEKEHPENVVKRRKRNAAKNTFGNLKSFQAVPTGQKISKKSNTIRTTC